MTLVVFSPLLSSQLRSWQQELLTVRHTQAVFYQLFCAFAWMHIPTSVSFTSLNSHSVIMAQKLSLNSHPHSWAELGFLVQSSQIITLSHCHGPRFMCPSISLDCELSRAETEHSLFTFISQTQCLGPRRYTAPAVGAEEPSTSVGMEPLFHLGYKYRAHTYSDAEATEIPSSQLQLSGIPLAIIKTSPFLNPALRVLLPSLV